MADSIRVCSAYCRISINGEVTNDGRDVYINITKGTPTSITAVVTSNATGNGTIRYEMVLGWQCHLMTFRDYNGSAITFTAPDGGEDTSFFIALM